MTSKLIVDPQQRREQLAGAVEKVATAALTPDYRKLLGRAALRERALVAGRGKLDEARLLTTAAALTLDQSVTAVDNPFVMRLFDKVVKAPDEPAAPQP